MRYESLGQQPYLPKIHGDRPTLLIDAEVADLDRGHLVLDIVRELRVRLSQITG